MPIISLFLLSFHKRYPILDLHIALYTCTIKKLYIYVTEEGGKKLAVR